ncbi:MAG: DivIVA domain-containing protein [Peptococcaceae bacterium]|nr:DivIVA domain-containing protein [Peptococcaceae bacterium]NQS76705.1 DivIVA domain-containing protein [Candidatus Syntrophopropionicum ammoniitolerans]
MLMPLDIQKKEFRHVLRGYSQDEVHAFLDQVAKEFENLIRENQELKEKVAQTEQNVARYQEIEEAIKNAMVMAQKNTDELKQNAEKEAQLLLEQTRVEADQLANEAKREAAERLHEAEKQLAVMTTEYEQIKQKARIFKTRLKSFLELQIKLIDQAGEFPAGEDLNLEDLQEAVAKNDVTLGA